MLHRIRTSQLELGMYVHELECSWLDHPFWLPRFLIDQQEQLQTISDSGIIWVTIDDQRGKAPAQSSPPVSVLGTAAAAGIIRRKEKRKSPVLGEQGRSRLLSRPLPEFKRLSPRERQREMRRASETIKRSRTAVMGLFEDARLGNSVKSDGLAPLVERISSSVDVEPAIILNMARLKSKDEYTYLHSVAVCALMINLARKLKLPEEQIHDIGMAGLLHDVGKTTIPDNILLKPGKLEEKEWITVRNHPQRGHDILAASEGVCDIALEVCLHHHEKMDGTGYPHRLSADTLSLFTRMSAVCDVYDAITSQRPYNRPFSASEALARMQSWKGHFDQLVLRDFVESLGILPVGTLVRLNHDELGIVIGESPKDYAAPIVRSFHSLDRDRPVEIEDIDMARSRSRRILAVEDPEDWGFADWQSRSAELLTTARSATK